ncbi:MAG: BamA/TamA family outer membrane protein, partial [Muribaculaceae bacterium]|nr:BamA/TamA family outer membrane protein [Muribaculaceae bacterium]
GSYRPDMSNENGFFDQTGNFKLEANIELRVPIWGGLEGALFVDAGNIWLLKKDDLRPGGELTLKSFGRDIALGTGLGVRYDIANYLVVRIDVGVPIHAPYYTQKSGYYNIEGSFWKNLRLHLAIGYPF